MLTQQQLQQLTGQNKPVTSDSNSLMQRNQQSMAGWLESAKNRQNTTDYRATPEGQSGLEETKKQAKSGFFDNPINKFIMGVGEFGAGVVKGAQSTILSLADLGAKGMDYVFQGGKNIQSIDETTEGIRLKYMTPEGKLQKAGFTTEQIAEFFVPAGKVAKAEKAIDIMTKGWKPFTKLVSRVGVKSAVSGAAAGGVEFAQTGDIEKAKTTALIGGGARGGMAVIGEGARALRIPERMYQMIFKSSKGKMVSELKAEGLAKLKQTNPDKFQRLVDEDIIKVGTGGNILVNDTLAEKALDMGLRGSVRNMASEVVEGTLDSELTVRKIAQSYAGKINLSEPQIRNTIRGIAEDYADVGLGEISKQADDIVAKMKIGSGKVSAETALDARRLLDQVRIGSSFDKPITKLSQTQGNLKQLADIVRRRVNKIPGMGDTMNDYSFYIETLETLANEAAKRGNAQVLGLIDNLFLSQGLGGGDIIPAATFGMLRKVFQSPSMLTKTASKINRSNISPFVSGLLSTASAGLSDLIQD